MVDNRTKELAASAIEALENGLDDPKKYREVYRKRRDFVLEELNKMGMETVKPEGAFYIFAKIPEKYGKDDMKFALDLAFDKKVGLTPGSAFGPGGDGYVRMSYASSDENLHEAMKRLAEFLN